MSVSAFPHGIISAAAASGGPTVLLDAFTSMSDFDISFASVTLEVERDGDYIPNGAVQTNEWVASGDKTSTIGDDYEVKLTKTSGGLASPSGPTLATWHTINIDRLWTWIYGGGSPAFWNGTLEIREIANTSNSDSSSVSIELETSGGGCPLCCFHPDTLIEMANGTMMPISRILTGDFVAVWDGEKKVPQEITEIIVRSDVPMFRLTFEDGRQLLLSADHPLHTERGPASISRHDYKNIGVPKKLRPGDRVAVDHGTWLKLVKVERDKYSGRVLTFHNQMFFANGVLAY